MSGYGKQTIERSLQYERLPPEDKIAADAILGYLNGATHQRAQLILYGVLEEISHLSTIRS